MRISDWSSDVCSSDLNERLFLGTLAAGGTLGILIPPSINLIIYAVLTDTSIPKLYLAGIIPGVGLALLFMVIVAVCCLVKPAWGGEKLSASWGERLRSLSDLIPPLGIFRSDEHTSELQSIMRTSYAVFCL